MTEETTRPTPPADKLQYAISLAKAGHKLEARDVLRRVVAAQPVNQAAWLWLSALASEQSEAEAALAQARKINPTHPSLQRAEQWLANHFSAQPLTTETVVVAPSLPPSPPAAETKNFASLFNSVSLVVAVVAILLGIVVLLVGLVVEAGATAEPEEGPAEATPAGAAPTEVPGHSLADYPELEQAWRQRDWAKAITILEGLYQADPGMAGLKDQLAHAYLQQGIALRHKGYVEEARPYFRQTLLVTPGQQRAQQELRLAETYIESGQAYQAGQWSKAITSLEAVRAEDEAYGHARDLLYSAYYNSGLALQAAGSLAEARTAFEAAIRLRPDLPEPRREIAGLDFALAPQTPLATPLPSAQAKYQLIVVGIAEQQMLVYEGKRQVFDFVVSTGEPGRDTAIGEFEILDKIDVAYASTWNLDMPYWMGIYWAGPLENGIHSLPIVRHTGYKLWDGYLGQRVSYGCIILSDEDSATLYDWAQIGAKVKIVPSLEDWLGQQGQ